MPACITGLREARVECGKSCTTQSTESLPLSLLQIWCLHLGHVMASPLDFHAERGHNRFGSGSWLTPRFGLAPQPVQASSGAVFVKGLRWWFDREIYGV